MSLGVWLVISNRADSGGLMDYIAQRPAGMRARFPVNIQADMAQARLPHCLAVARDALAEHGFSQKMTAP